MFRRTLSAITRAVLRREPDVRERQDREKTALRFVRKTLKNVPKPDERTLRAIQQAEHALLGTDSEKSAQAVNSLRAVRHPFALVPLTRALTHWDRVVRVRAVQQLQTFTHPAATTLLRGALRDKEHNTRSFAIQALVRRHAPGLTQNLIETLNRYPHHAWTIVDALRDKAEPKGIHAIAQYAQHHPGTENGQLANQALMTLAADGRIDAVAPLVRALPTLTREDLSRARRSLCTYLEEHHENANPNHATSKALERVVPYLQRDGNGNLVEIDEVIAAALHALFTRRRNQRVTTRRQAKLFIQQLRDRHARDQLKP